MVSLKCVPVFECEGKFFVTFECVHFRTPRTAIPLPYHDQSNPCCSHLLRPALSHHHHHHHHRHHDARRHRRHPHPRRRLGVDVLV